MVSNDLCTLLSRASWQHCVRPLSDSLLDHAAGQGLDGLSRSTRAHHSGVRAVSDWIRSRMCDHGFRLPGNDHKTIIVAARVPHWHRT